ncbi:sensor histidine kinase [Haliangium ochraceum]|uniref:histidine kinase n=1 Tax=Haliangium ochraceum (strain DSM 14365 / JCM 11303 / SMP-2) TaxID=502025 RepID=D0LTW1_HALO1|nr:HAMP domain-containing sensor histidine kinase [Haliangium ochraceum]ACY15805.1 integral membrane sensor signal transduction histidine kinase [Haliangium ochraceum DSM 14365]
MKVGARITIATSALVSVIVGAYAFLDLRAEANERRETIEREAGQLARALRTSIEAVGPQAVLADRADFLSAVAAPMSPWQVSLLSVSAAAGGDGAGDPSERERLRKLQEVPELAMLAQEGERFIYVLPVRVPDPRQPSGTRVLASLEVSRSVAFLSTAQRDDLLRTLPLLVLVLIVVTIAIRVLTSSLMSRPMGKLLAGIDDVAQGDLSRVLLSERDDEIGALATRFNEMTYYLRESRAETQRQNQARLELEQRLRQTEKMATIGLFAAEIAHELGTPLNVIAARARTLNRKANSPEAVQKNADIISEQVARITRIIQQTLDHARLDSGPPSQEPVALADLIHSTLALFEGKLTAARIDTDHAPGEEPIAVPGDPDRLQQVLINLVNNALQAMPQGGRLGIATRVLSRRRPGLEHAPEQDYAVIDVSDSGAGVPPEERERIFEPFYTSRRSEGGTGLGLAVCYSIVKDHDGWIDIDDAAGGGTVFSVYLPTEDSAA